mmetsp:Transcript_13399/g.29102  ORF Transcript_13399/g.29102 Transcript_13399/m.29102 type:complete len:83 (+) Transcript_13399:1247-1495(+)
MGYNVDGYVKYGTKQLVGRLRIDCVDGEDLCILLQAISRIDIDAILLIVFEFADTDGACNILEATANWTIVSSVKSIVGAFM